VGRLLVLASTLAACNFSLPGGAAQQDATGPGSDAPMIDMPPVTPAWAFKRKLTIQNTGLGAHAQLAVAVFLDATRINYAATLPGGADLRFSDAGGTTLAHEIEVWEPGGRSLVWVDIPSIAANTTTDFFMFYGNPQATDGQNPAAVWDADFVGVWHLADAHESSTRLVSTDVNSTPVLGQLGPARQFSGAGQYIDTGSQQYLTTWTVEAWMNPATQSLNTGAGAVVSGFPNYLILWNCITSTFCHTVLYNDSNSSNFVSFTANVGAWNYVAGTYDGTTLRSFFGATSTVSQTFVDDPVAATATTKIATHANLNGDYNGGIDEVRISRTARSSDYVNAQRRSQTDTYLAYGDEEAN